MIATNELRYVERPIPQMSSFITHRVLQQKWIVEGKDRINKEKWLDIPVVNNGSINKQT